MKEFPEIRFAGKTEFRKTGHVDFFIIVCINIVKRRHDALNVTVIPDGIRGFIRIVIAVEKEHQLPRQAPDHGTVSFRAIPDLEEDIPDALRDFRMLRTVDDVLERSSAVLRQLQTVGIASDVVGEQTDRVQKQKSPAGRPARTPLRNMHLVRVDDNSIPFFERKDLSADNENSRSVKTVSDLEKVMNMRGDIRMLRTGIEVRLRHGKLRINRNAFHPTGLKQCAIF